MSGSSDDADAVPKGLYDAKRVKLGFGQLDRVGRAGACARRATC